jgi:hypothetical protein
MRMNMKLLAATAVAGLLGVASGHVFAAAAVDRLATTTDSRAGGVYVGLGENEEQMKRAAARGITKYEDVDKEGGGGAPSKVLIDNAAVKVIMVAFPKGFHRPGNVKRRYNTLLIYPNAASYRPYDMATGKIVETSQPSKLAAGTVVYHWKESIVTPMEMQMDYNVLFVQMKN